MFRRNFDFIAVGLVLAGMAVIQQVPQFGQRMSVGMVRYQSAVAAKPCPIANLFSSRVRVRQPE